MNGLKLPVDMPSYPCLSLSASFMPKQADWREAASLAACSQNHFLVQPAQKQPIMLKNRTELSCAAVATQGESINATCVFSLWGSPVLWQGVDMDKSRRGHDPACCCHSVMAATVRTGGAQAHMSKVISVICHFSRYTVEAVCRAKPLGLPVKLSCYWLLRCSLNIFVFYLLQIGLDFFSCTMYNSWLLTAASGKSVGTKVKAERLRPLRFILRALLRFSTPLNLHHIWN